MSKELIKCCGVEPVLEETPYILTTGAHYKYKCPKCGAKSFFGTDKDLSDVLITAWNRVVKK